MVTYSDLFTFVIMIVAILTYIDSHNNKKKQRPCSGKVRRYLNSSFISPERIGLVYRASCSVKYIICQVGLFVKYNKTAPAPTGTVCYISEDIQEVLTKYIVSSSEQFNNQNIYSVVGCYFYTQKQKGR